MLNYTENEEKRIVEITVAGVIKKQELTEVIAKLEARIKDWGKLRLVKRIESFSGISPSAILDDLKFAFNHYKDFQKVAIVTDKEWVEKVAHLVKNFAPCEYKIFENDELEEARAWLL